MLLGAWVPQQLDPSRILDIGTGTGVLALMMAQRFPDAEIEAVEIDNASAMECLCNFNNSPWPGRLKIFNADFLSWQTTAKFDLIITNPPYFATSTRSPKHSRDVARNQASLPLDVLLKKSQQLLRPDGKLFLVYPAESLHLLKTEAAFAGLYLTRLCKVRTSPKKDFSLVLVEMSTSFSKIIEEDLSIKEINGQYTNDYLHLTDDFYLFLH